MSVRPASIDFTVGSRRLFAVPRQLETLSFTLEDIVSGRMPSIPLETRDADGFRVLSAPRDGIEDLLALLGKHAIGARQDYDRHYIDMTLGHDGYLAQFSGKTRSTLRRKQRKLAEECGGAYRFEEFRTPAEVESFIARALPLSAMTYQARLLDAGLPETGEAQAELLALAAEDKLRCFLLSAGTTPIAYLALPIRAETLVYAWLGYHPDWARLSPGTVLQMEALERLFGEQRYRWFDFTEGDGAHKALFGTASVQCSSFILLKPTIANRALLSARSGFDSTIAATKTIAEKSGALAKVRGLLRA